MQRNKFTASVANELAMHSEDLSDSGEEVRDEEGNPIGALYLDTTITNEPHSFIIVLGGDRHMLVTVRQLEEHEKAAIK